MADLTSVYDALRNAHAAGDTAAAEKLASYIQSQSGNGSAEPSMITKGVGSAARGIAGMLDIVPTLGAAAYEKMGGTVDKSKFNPHASTELVNDLLPAKYDGLTGAAIEGAAAGGLTGIGRKLALEMAMGALSGGGAETAKEMGGGGVEQLAAGVAAPTLGGSLARMVAGAGRGAKGIADVVANPERVAAGVFQKGASNAENLADRLRSSSAETAGVPLTSGQALRDVGLSQQELARRSRSGTAFEGVDVKQRNAMADALKKIARTPEERAALVAARSSETSPMMESIRNQVMPQSYELQSLIARSEAAGGATMAKNIAGIEGKKFTLPVINDASSPLSIADFEAMNAGRPSHPDLVLGGVPDSFPVDDRLLSEIRKRGGLHMSEMRDLVGERATNKSGAQVGVFTNKGRELQDMAETLVSERILPPSILDGNGGARNLGEKIQSALNPQYDKNLGAYYDAEVLPGAFHEGVAAAPLQNGGVSTGGNTISGESLDYLRKGVNQAMGEQNAPIPQLMQLKNDLSKYIEGQSPEYAQGVKRFAEMSQPINKIDVGQKLYEKFVPAMADIAQGSPAMRGDVYKTRANALAEALRNGDQTAKLATGFSGAKLANILSEGEIKSARGVVSDAARIADALSSGVGKGSPTYRYAAQNEMIGQHIADVAGLPDWARSIATSKAVGYSAGLPFKVIGAALGGASDRLNVPIGEVLDRMHADPKYAADILDKAAIPLDQKKKIFSAVVNPRSGGIAGALQQSTKE